MQWACRVLYLSVRCTLRYPSEYRWTGTVCTTLDSSRILTVFAPLNVDPTLTLVIGKDGSP